MLCSSFNIVFASFSLLASFWQNRENGCIMSASYDQR
jgi:hypothetical protein